MFEGETIIALRVLHSSVVRYAIRALDVCQGEAKDWARRFGFLFNMTNRGLQGKV